MSSPASSVPDEVLVARAGAGDRLAFELLMRRNNQRVYRVVRSVLREPDEIEDVMQESYLSAFQHASQFEGGSRWSTWVCKIAFNAALARVRRRRAFVTVEGTTEPAESAAPDPERTAAERELVTFLERAIDELPDIHRSVLVLRQVEGLSTAETARVLDVEEDVVKTRLHRARAQLRAAVEARLGEQLDAAYAFRATRCDRVVAGVLARLPLA